MHAEPLLEKEDRLGANIRLFCVRQHATAEDGQFLHTTQKEKMHPGPLYHMA